MKKEKRNSDKMKLTGPGALLTKILTLVAVLAVAALLIFIFVTGNRTDPSYFTIEDGVLTAYEGNDRVVTIPDGVTVIGERAFMDHEEIEKVVMPQTLTTLRNGAFYNCSSLETIRFSRSLNFIGDAAFGECDALTEFTLPASVQYIHSEAFYDVQSIESFAVEAGNEYYQAKDGVIYSADGEVLVLYPAGRAASNFQVPDGVLAISVGAFAANTKLKEVDLGSVVEIGENAFQNCTALEKVVLPETVRVIHESAFGSCTVLHTVEMAEGLEMIGDSAFTSCESLVSVTLPNSLQEIGRYSFSYCTALEEIHIPAEMVGLYEGAFEGSENVTIYSAEGAPAQAFAETYGIPFLAE